MISEHKKIKEIFNKFEKEENSEKREELYNNFKWAIEKHIFVEEKAIFTFSQNISGRIVSDVFRLMDEHGEILNLIKEIEYESDKDIEPVFSELKEILKNHEKFEEETFYPGLDKMLNNQQKAELIERIKEVVH